jgi:hypothetical protein
MLQVATFLVPEQQEQANEFLKKHRPEGTINFNKDTVVIFWETGEFPPEYEIANLTELLQSNRQAKLQQEIALHVMKAELADLNMKHNKGRYEEVFNAVRQTETAISIQDIKAAFVQGRIDALKSGLKK